MLEHKEGDSKTSTDNLPLVAPGYDSNIATIVAIGLLLIGIAVVVIILSR